MAEATDNLILEHLRAIRGNLDLLRDDVQDLKRRMTSMEAQIAQV
jgi:hypothetical protein